MTHSQRREALTPHICVTWIQAFTRSYVWLELCDMGSSHLFICVTGFSLIHEWVERKKVQKCLSAFEKMGGYSFMSEWKKNVKKWLSGWKTMRKNEWVPIIRVKGHSLVHMYDMKTRIILGCFLFPLVFHSEHKKTLSKYECFMSRLWMSQSHVRDMMHSGRVHIYMKWLICEWVISHTAMRHVTSTKDSFHTH